MLGANDMISCNGWAYSFSSVQQSNLSAWFGSLQWFKDALPNNRANLRELSLSETLIRMIPPPTDQYKAPTNPVVLCHGLSGFDKIILIPSIYQLMKMIRESIVSNHSDSFMQDEDDGCAHEDALLRIDYWIGIRQALEARGCTVLTARVPGFGSIEDRARQLNSFIDSELGRIKKTSVRSEVYNAETENSKPFKAEEKIKVNLIAHSMGGLDCRYLITHVPNKNFQVSSLTTISTPHHGSEMADYVVNLFQDMTTSAEKKPLLPPAFYQLTTDYCKHFNEITPDDPDVAYFSYGACFKPSWFNMFYMPWYIIDSLSGGVPNDGMVSVESAKWGTYLGTLENVDHSDLINWKNRLQKDVQYRLKGVFKKQQNPDIDILDFYLKVTEDLAKMGF